MIRFFLLNALICVVSLVFCLIGLGISLFDRGGRKVHRYIARPWARLILWLCSVKVRVLGTENIESTVPRLYLSNHQSYFDILALLAYLPVDFKFVMKKELMKLPIFGLTMRKAGYISIDREDPRNALRGLNEASEKMRNGASVLIFPEGTRSPDGRLQSFKPGAFHMALKARCDVVPIAVMGSRFIIPKGSFRIQPGAFTLHLGSPIAVSAFSKKDMPLLMEQVREAMLQLMSAGEN